MFNVLRLVTPRSQRCPFDTYVISLPPEIRKEGLKFVPPEQRIKKRLEWCSLLSWNRPYCRSAFPIPI